MSPDWNEMFNLGSAIRAANSASHHEVLSNPALEPRLGFPGTGTPGARDKLTMADVTESLVDAKIAASEARSATAGARIEGKMDTGFARMEGKLDALAGTLTEMRSDSRSVKSNIWAATAVIFAALALTVGVTIAVLPWAIGFGSSMRDLARDEAKAAQTKQP